MKLTDITPKRMGCGPVGCPAIFEKDNDTYIIVGKKVSSELRKKLAKKIATDEVAVEIPRALLSELKK